MNTLLCAGSTVNLEDCVEKSYESEKKVKIVVFTDSNRD